MKYYSIRFGAYKNLSYATEAVSKLTKRNYEAFYRHEEVKGKGKWYRVYVGRFDSRKDAKVIAEELRNLGLISEYFISSITDYEKSVDKKEQTIENKSDHVKTSDTQEEKNESIIPLVKSPENVLTKNNPVRITDIRLDIEKPDTETVLVYASDFFTPVTFPLEGEKPRIVVDIKNAISIKNGLSNIKVDGRLIKRIRSYLYRDSNRLRIVLDLDPTKNYYTDQFFYKKENVYSLDVKEDRSD